MSPRRVEREGGHLGPVYQGGYGEALRHKCLHLQVKACIWGIIESLIRANARFIEMAGSCALIGKGGSAFFPLSSLSWWKWDPCCWWKEPQCEGTEKKVLRSSILWHFIEDLINQINHHVTPSSSHKLVIEHGKYNCNFLGVLFRSAGALEWSLNLFDSS